jgi:hypothetical protein
MNISCPSTTKCQVIDIVRNPYELLAFKIGPASEIESVQRSLFDRLKARFGKPTCELV